jgi:hypothetical protein
MDKKIITAEEYLTKMRTVKKSKYKNEKQTTFENGKIRSIDSRKEHYHKGKFEMQMRSNEAVRPVKVESGVWFDLVVNNELICRYKMDLRVTYNNGMVRHIDVKPTFKTKAGEAAYKKTAAWGTFRIKSKLMQAIYGITIEII